MRETGKEETAKAAAPGIGGRRLRSGSAVSAVSVVSVVSTVSAVQLALVVRVVLDQYQLLACQKFHAPQGLP